MQGNPPPRHIDTELSAHSVLQQKISWFVTALRRPPRNCVPLFSNCSLFCRYSALEGSICTAWVRWMRALSYRPLCQKIIPIKKCHSAVRSCTCVKNISARRQSPICNSIRTYWKTCSLVIIRGVDLFHFLHRFIMLRRILILVRMPFFYQAPIRFFNFLFTSPWFYAQYIIRVQRFLLLYPRPPASFPAAHKLAYVL